MLISTRHNNHDISISRKCVDSRSKMRISNFHALEIKLRLGATNLELLDDIRNALAAMAIILFRTVVTIVLIESKHCHLNQ